MTMDQKACTKELSYLESYINDIWQFVPLPLAYINPMGVILDIDQSFEILIKIRKEDIIGRLLADFFDPQTAIEGVYKTTIEKGQCHCEECYLKIGDNSLISASISTIARKDDSGETIGIFLALIDRTKRNQAEKILRESEEKYRAAVEQSAENIFIIDLKTKKILEANKSLEDLIGYSSKEIKDLTIYDFIDHAKEDIDEKIQEIFAKKSIFLSERHYRHKNGTIIPVEVSASYITYGDKKAISVVSRNITSRLKAEHELKRSFLQLQKTINSVVEAMSRVVETRDPYTAGHQRRVADLARAIAGLLNLPDVQIQGIYMAALIHDIGKLYLPAEILVKPIELTPLEFEMVKTHTTVGYDIVKTIAFPWPVADIILQHHERLNGTGYPKGLQGKDILLEAKILAVADVVEAMASNRPYRPAKTIDASLDEISVNKNILYDPDAVDACLELFRERDFAFNNVEPRPRHISTTRRD
jgi:PAS domain S-box-containing protein/putative nucleotidyltransferase with HDIG domain